MTEGRAQKAEASLQKDKQPQAAVPASGLRPPSSALRARELFVPNLEARKLVSTWIDQRLQQQLDAGERRLTSISAAEPSSRHPRLRERLDQLNNWHEKARAVLPLVKTFLNMPAATTMAQMMNPFRRKKASPTV